MVDFLVLGTVQLIGARVGLDQEPGVEAICKAMNRPAAQRIIRP